jgi:CPA2 family monovalent cation:H+ antiporter-2
MDGLSLLQDLALVLLAAGVAGALCRKLGLSVIVGYLVAGIIIGPFNLPFTYIQDLARVQTLSQIGLVFLMFSIGLGLSLSKLGRMGIGPFIATALGALMVLSAGRLVFALFGLSGIEAFFLAAMLTVSSSAVIAKVIKDLNLSHERAGQVGLSITVLEDVVAVVMLTILGAEVAANTSAAPPGIAALLASLSAFVVLLIGTGLFVLPRLLRRLQTTFDSELLTIVVAGLLLLMAVLAVEAGYSLALGAFLLGAMVADTPQKSAIEGAFSGMRDMFSSVFFVAIGMLIDVGKLWELWPLILGLTAFTLVVRSMGLFAALTLVGTPTEVSRRSALLLTPVGEFSFVIAQLGVSSGVLDERFYPIAVGVSILTVFLAPLVNKKADVMVAVTMRWQPAWLTRLMHDYPAWMARQSAPVFRGIWWKLMRKRLIQIAGELLLVAGLLGFSPLLQRLLLSNPWIAQNQPVAWQIGFWAIFALVLVIPLNALWRNLGAMAMITAEAIGHSTRAPKALIESTLKLIAACGLAGWLFEFVPFDLLPRWSWGAIAAAMILTVIFFTRRLILWHSHWQYSVEGVLTSSAAHDPSITHTSTWHESGRNWGLKLSEIRLPENSAAAGKTIRQLAIRTRYGCAIAEINRAGVLLPTPGPDAMLFSGDRLLLIGELDAIARARSEFAITTGRERFDFEEASLEYIDRLPASWTGLTIADAVGRSDLGLMIVGLQREGVPQVNPGATEILRETDHLLVLGSPRQLARLQTLVDGPDNNNVSTRS